MAICTQDGCRVGQVELGGADAARVGRDIAFEMFACLRFQDRRLAGGSSSSTETALCLRLVPHSTRRQALAYPEQSATNVRASRRLTVAGSRPQGRCAVTSARALPSNRRRRLIKGPALPHPCAREGCLCPPTALTRAVGFLPREGGGAFAARSVRRGHRCRQQLLLGRHCRRPPARCCHWAVFADAQTAGVGGHCLRSVG